MDNIDFVDGKTSFIFLGQQPSGCCFQNIIFSLILHMQDGYSLPLCSSACYLLTFIYTSALSSGPHNNIP